MHVSTCKYPRALVEITGMRMPSPGYTVEEDLQWICRPMQIEQTIRFRYHMQPIDKADMQVTYSLYALG